MRSEQEFTSAEGVGKLPEKVYSSTEIRIPYVISAQPIIAPEEAFAVAMDLTIPNTDSTNRQEAAQRGLRFCRGRGLSAQVAMTHYQEEASRLPNTRRELVTHFATVTRQQVDKNISEYTQTREQIERDLFNYEKDVLQACGIAIPEHITETDDYFRWIARTDKKPYEPTQHDLDAMRCEFYRKHAYVVRMAYREFNPVEAWGKYVEKILKHNEEYNRAAVKNGYPQKIGRGLLSRTFFQEHRDYYAHTKYLSFLKEDQDYPSDSLLFHTTSVSNAIDIVSSGGLMVGSVLGGSSFSANGLTHPMGRTSKEHGKTSVAFVSEYGQLRVCCNAAAFPEGSREFEQEVRSPLPTPNGVMIGIVPIDTTLFPDVLRTGYGGSTLLGGDVISSWRENYKRTGTMFSENQRQYIQNLAGK